MDILKNLLLIAGTGRNTGKTSLACAIIQHFHNNHSIIGIKISPHFHAVNKGEKALISNSNWSIFEETNYNRSKDSSKMLSAGANKVYYMEVLDEHLPEAFESLLKIIPTKAMLVCESPALRKFIDPSVFFIVDHPRQKNKKQDVLKMRPLADFFIKTNEIHVEQLIPGLKIQAETWHFDELKINPHQNK